MDIQLEGWAAMVAMFAFMAVPLSIITFALANSARFARRKKQLFDNVIVAEYEPPGHLSPAEIGYLFDSRFGKEELMATLIDLEQKGLIEISGSGGKVNIRKLGVEISSQFKLHEQYVLSTLARPTSVSIYSLVNMWGFKSSVKKSLTQQGFIKTQSESASFLAQRTIVAYFVITVPLFLWFQFGAEGSFFGKLIALIVLSVILFPFFISLSIISGYIYNKIIGQPGLWTQKLKQLWPQLQGYRDYVELVELGRLKFESKELKERSTNKALPYAIALGLNTEWRKRFS